MRHPVHTSYMFLAFPRRILSNEKTIHYLLYYTRASKWRNEARNIIFFSYTGGRQFIRALLYYTHCSTAKTSVYINNNNSSRVLRQCVRSESL